MLVAASGETPGGLKHFTRLIRKEHNSTKTDENQVEESVLSFADLDSDDIDSYTYLYEYHYRIRTHIATFPANVREVLTYNLFERKIDEEIALLLNIPLKNFRGRMVKGYNMIRDRFPNFALYLVNKELN